MSMDQLPLRPRRIWGHRKGFERSLAKGLRDSLACHFALFRNAPRASPAHAGGASSSF